MAEKHIDPMRFHGMGTCPECGNNLMIIDSEMNYFVINDEGESVSYEEAYSRCEAVCMKCGYSKPMKRTNFGYDVMSPLKDAMRRNMRKKIPEAEKIVIVRELI